MKSILLFFLFVFGFSTFWLNSNDPLFTVETSNEGSFSVFELKDEEGLLTGYTSQIKAPVCEEGVCYDVNIIFNWNVIGAFTHFDTIENAPLTKLDHIPFSPSDYSKLQSILTNFDLKFTGMSADKLVSKTKKDGLDAYSGATVAAIKDEVIGGALFTCHTLWHIANGAVVDSIKQSTAQKLDPKLVKQIAQLSSLKAQYYLIDHLEDEKWEENLDIILGMIESSEGYFAKNTFEKMPIALFPNPEVWLFIKDNYAEFDYYTRIAILNQLLKSTDLSSDVMQVCIENLSDQITSESVKVIDLVLRQNDLELLKEISERLAKKEIKLTPKQAKKLVEKLNTKP